MQRLSKSHKVSGKTFENFEKGHSSVGNQEIVEHNYKFAHEEYLC